MKESHMATNTITLEGEVRDQFGKGVARRLRVANKIPATIYAGGNQPVFVTLPMKETTLALRHTNALFTINYGGDSKIAVVKDVQRNPVKRIVEHVDFYEVKAGEKIDVEVPVFIEGTPKGAAVAFVDIQELKVRADVSNLPERIVINVDGMTDGSKVFAKDIELPEGAELDIDDPEESVVTVEVPEDATESTAETADTAAAAPAADAAAPAADAAADNK
jgi:large subunit ribosomal protein L25